MTLRRSVLLFAFIALASPALAASPREELLRLVPGDVGFCVALEDLRGHSGQLLESPFFDQWRRSPMGAILGQDRDWQSFAESRKQVEQLLGLEWTKLRDDILGDAVVFAYRPGPPDKPTEDRSLILIRARDPQALAKLVERINLMQIGSRDLKEIEPREHKGQRYFHRVNAKGANFYALLGAILAVSSQESMLRDALDQVQSSSPQAESAVALRMRSLLGPERRLVSLWINPRAFDAAIVGKTKEGTEEQAAVVKAVSRYWKALDGVAVGVSMREHLECTLAVRAQPSQLSAAARRFLAEGAKPSDLWRHFPDKAMLAVAGRFDPSAFAEWLGEFLTPQAQATLRDGLDRFVGAAVDKDVLKDVLPCLGPDLGLCVIAPDDADKDWMPRAVFAVRVRPGDKPPFVDQAVLSAINTVAQMAVIDHNSKNPDRMVLKTDVRDKVEIKYLVNPKRFPPGLTPAFALRDGYVLLGTSPAAIRTISETRSLAADEAGEVPLLRLSLKELCRYLQAHRKPLAAALADQNKSKPEEVERQLDGIAQVVEWLDRLDISQRSADGQATLTLRLRTTHALRK